MTDDKLGTETVRVEMSSNNSQSGDSIPWGCIGTVVAALITALVALLISMRSTPSFPTVAIHNNLRLPVHVYVGESYDRRLEPGQEATIKLDQEPVNIRTEIIRATTYVRKPNRRSNGGYLLQGFWGCQAGNYS